MRRSNFAIALWLAAALAAGCSSSSSKPAPTPACFNNGATCAQAADCCSGACTGTCVDPGTCTTTGGACDVAGDCCTNTCENSVCIDPHVCGLIGDACVLDGNCCNGHCDSGGTHLCYEPPPPPPGTCGEEGATCMGVGDLPCCSGTCDTRNGSPYHCRTDTFCTPAGAACDGAQCCSGTCTDAGSCSSTFCKPSGTTSASACAAHSQCCSGNCSGGFCTVLAPVGGLTCKTLGETCGLGSECCSTLCSGGACASAYTCNAYGDVCYRPQDCCSGMCTVADGSAVAGRCEKPSGSGCTQDGAPCGGDSNCCTRECVDLGSGATVCQPAGGCRMTGDYCDSTQSCCGGTDPDQATSTVIAPSPYGVYCDMTGTRNYTPFWDPSSKDNHVCSSGQSCNPPGNICGGSGADKAPASQNCCNSNPTGSGKDVCKPDLNGIMRCFGGGSATCPTGYDGANPACCIPSDGACNMASECCGFANCSADDRGVLRCNGSSCLSIGTQCTTDGQCCSGTTCVPIPEMGFSACATAPPPNGCSKNIGQACGGSNGTCCIGSCIGGVCNYACSTTGATCTQASQCCSNICTSNHCATACIADGGTGCTAATDCCTGLSCTIPPGATSGTCTTGTGPTCASSGQSCTGAITTCCDASESCQGGVCAPTAPQCPSVSQSCSTTNPCCSGLDCHKTIGTSDFPYTCTAGASSCFCEDCAAQGETCTATFGCCLASQSYCATATLSSCGVGDTNCLCRDARL